VIHCGLISVAFLLAWLAATQSCPAQEAPPPTQEKKPAATPGKGDDSGKGGPAGMMSQMKGRMGGMQGMMSRMVGQPGKPAQAAEPTLEEMLNKALKDNPDIRVAEAKVREAEAELNRTRLQVTQKVLAFHHLRESQKAVIKVSEEDLQRIAKLNASKAIGQEELRLAQQRLSAAKAKLAEVEAEMPYLIGQQHRLTVGSVTFSPDGKTVLSTTDGTVRFLDASTGKQLGNRASFEIDPQTLTINDTDPFGYFHSLQPFLMRGGSPQEAGTIVDKVRKALDTKVTVDYRNKHVSEILEDLKKRAPGLSIHDLSGISNLQISLQIDGQVPLRTVLELLEDTCSVLFPLQGDPPGRRSFVLRDYGLLFAPNESLPPGAVHISNLGPAVPITKPKEKPAEKTEEKGPPEKKH